MKKIICKKEYDTDTAKELKRVSHGSFGDPEGYEEVLYVTDGGGYFLYTRGGEKSKYPKEDIKRISAKAKESWMEEVHHDASQ